MSGRISPAGTLPSCASAVLFVQQAFHRKCMRPRVRSLCRFIILCIRLGPHYIAKQPLTEKGCQHQPAVPASSAA